jgi:hypothetical protein
MYVIFIPVPYMRILIGFLLQETGAKVAKDFKEPEILESV